MKTWSTKIYAICPIEDEVKAYDGPNIMAPTWEEAMEWCQENGLEYCHVDGEVKEDIAEHANYLYGFHRDN